MKQSIKNATTSASPVVSTCTATAWETVKPVVSVVKQYKYTLTGVVVTGVACATVGHVVAGACAVATSVAFVRENKTIRDYTDKAIESALENIKARRAEYAKLHVAVA